jgi:hypothetical protein
MKTIIMVCISFVIAASAQTNLISTNPPVVGRQKLESQLASVKKVLSQYYTFEKDPVTEQINFSQIEYDYLATGDITGKETMRINVNAWVYPSKKLPEDIGLHIVSHSDEWMFTDDHDLTIRFDEQKFSPAESFYSNKVSDDSTVYEMLLPRFTLEQFRQMAWADKVYFKLGYENFEISSEQRKKWKLLWKYFDLQKSLTADTTDADVKKALGEP